jgi:hypothetical protein
LEADEFIDWLAMHVNPDWISNRIVREIFKRRIELHESKPWQGISAFLNEFDKHQQVITEVLTGELVERTKDGTRTTLRKQQDRSTEQLPDVVLKLRNQFLDRQIAASIQRASQPQMGEAERLELSREQQTLRQQKREPLK